MSQQNNFVSYADHTKFWCSCHWQLNSDSKEQHFILENKNPAKIRNYKYIENNFNYNDHKRPNNNFNLN